MSKHLQLQSSQAQLTLEFDQLDTMQAQLNVKLTVEWTIGYTTDRRHTYPIELRITTSFYWGFLPVLLRFLEFYAKEMLKNQQKTAPK